MDSLNIKFKKLVNEVKVDMHNQNVRYDETYRIIIDDLDSTTWGICYTYKNLIIINKILVKHGRDEDIKNCICHELIHSIPECLYDNHGPRFKKYASIMNDAGYNIHTHSDYVLSKEAYDEAKYIVKCKSCGNLHIRMRMSKLIKHPNDFKCHCGGELTRIK